MRAEPTPFEWFGSQHLVTMFVIGLVAIGLPFWLRGRDSEPTIDKGAKTLAVILLIAKVTEPFYHIGAGLRWPEALPLHLCDLGGFLAVFMLLTRNYAAYELTYFWGLGGALQAILTPSVKFAFPHPHFLYFFITHGLIIVCAIYATVLFRFRPRLRSITRTFWVTAVCAALIAPINWLLDTNFLYLCAKPDVATILDFLGPWPWYLLALVPLSVLIFFVYYSPFWISDRIQDLRQS